jgi:hypothetical protein
MAVMSNPMASGLQLKVATGVDGDGKDIIKTRSYNNVKASAVDQDVFDVANSMAGLQKNTLKQVIKTDKTELVNL